MPTTTPFANLITFSRGSNATVVGPNGLVQWAPANFAASSESFDATVWSKLAAAVYANQDLAGGTLGSERVSNGEFTSGTDWTLDAGASIGSGLLTFASVSSTFGANQTLASGFSAGQFAQVTLKVDSITAGQFRVRLNGGTYYLVPTSPGTYTFYVQAGSGSNQLQIHAAGTTSGTIDFISVKQATPAAATAPDGTRTADNLIEDSTTAGHGVQYLSVYSSGAVPAKTNSIYLKAAGRNRAAVGFSSSGGLIVNTYAVFDLSTGTVVTAPSAPSTAAITAVGNGWYRVSVTSAALSAAEDRFVVNLLRNSDTVPTSYTGDGVSGMLFWGAQAELGSTATTYNPTTVKNLLGFSEAFDNAGWTKSNSSIVTGAQANPVNGLFNAQKLMENTANAEHRVSLVTGTTVVGARTTISFYAKAAERNKVRIYNFAMNNLTVFFDLTNGVSTRTVGGTSPEHGTVALGNGWYRCYVTDVSTAANQDFSVNLVSTGTTTSYTGDGNSGIYIYGAQLSDSASLDPYVPTPGAAPSSTAYYGPRFDYNPVTLQPRGILIEEQRSNLLVRSEEFDNASWNKTRASITANATTSPDGTVNADKLVEDTTASESHFAQQVVTVVNATTYTWTVYAKAAERTWLCLYNSNVTQGKFFNLSNGTLGSDFVGAPGSAAITNAGNGWYRCSITFTTTGTTATLIHYLGSADGVAAYTGNGTSGLFLWGAQLEAGAFATSYIPTIASTVTRSADVATITGQNFGQWYTQSEGCFVLDFSVLSTSVNADVMIASTSGSFNPGSSGIYGNNAYQTYVRSGSTYVANLAATGTTTPNTPNKLAYAYSAASVANSFKGGAATSFTPTGTMPTTVNQLSWFGTGVTGTVQSGHIRSIRYIPVRAADFQLQALTT